VPVVMTEQHGGVGAFSEFKFTHAELFLPASLLWLRHLSRHGKY
jgi:hypothetical protein